MKFKFSNKLEYQIDAVNAVADIFGVEEVGGTAPAGRGAFAFQSYGAVVPNELEFNEKRLLKNVQTIQARNQIDDASIALGPLDFSIEMETGTGKTYVYLRTAMELNKRYGLKKFIILVPSVAIREGVLKSLEQTKTHFVEMYDFGFNYFAYDSSKLSQVRNDFVQSPDMQIMVMTVQSFNKDANILRQSDRDNTHGERYLDLIAQTRPVVIMDEPQNMESELSKAAISELNPLFRLRYSATHKEKHNLMYRLTPVDAYKMGLVKRIEVYGVTEDDASAFVFQVLEVKTKKGASPTAEVNLEIKNKSGEYTVAKKTVHGGEDIFVVSGKNEKYTGLMVSEIDARTNSVELSDGKKYVAEAGAENREAIFRTQIKETIKTHFRKQADFGDTMKVLSLFFIDKVDNYVHDDSLIKKLFEEEYAKLVSTSERFRTLSSNDVHRGYFAKKVTKKGDEYKDTRGDSQIDKDAYDLIMRDKERLLSFSEPVSFIFSHSTLREGWDNPNIFQICTLNETRSSMKKRQEIGRGLRLPVDTDGNRIFDDHINVLTVVANESYREFVGTLQGEYKETGYTGAPQTGDARERIDVTFNKQLMSESEDFKNLWAAIRRRTRFNIEINQSDLVRRSIALVNEIPPRAAAVRVEKGTVVIEDDGTFMQVREGNAYGERLTHGAQIEDLVGRLVREVTITRQTAYEILTGSETFGNLLLNPEDYIRNTITCVKYALNEILENEGLRYYPIEDMWEVDLFENFPTYESKALAMKENKSLYSHVVWDSEGERDFAKALDASEHVTLFTKLPRRFVVETPLGDYNPDWAIVWRGTDGTEKLYLVRETKFVEDIHNLRPSEQAKINCGKKHFEAIGVNFDVATKSDLSDLLG